jgi:Ser/Thr protein kinase RdoA (MazF antagonist)
LPSSTKIPDDEIYISSEENSSHIVEKYEILRKFKGSQQNFQMVFLVKDEEGNRHVLKFYQLSERNEFIQEQKVFHLSSPRLITGT